VARTFRMLSSRYPGSNFIFPLLSPPTFAGGHPLRRFFSVDCLHFLLMSAQDPAALLSSPWRRSISFEPSSSDAPFIPPSLSKVFCSGFSWQPQILPTFFPLLALLFPKPFSEPLFFYNTGGYVRQGPFASLRELT